MSNRQRVCRMCLTPHRVDCEHCPLCRDSLKVQENTIRELKLKLLGHQELQIEHFRMKNQHQRLRKEFTELNDVYINQIRLIYVQY